MNRAFSSQLRPPIFCKWKERVVLGVITLVSGVDIIGGYIYKLSIMFHACQDNITGPNNVCGNAIEKYELKGITKHTIKKENKASGVYFLEVDADGKTHHKRLVIQ